MPKCRPDQIINPATNRCVLKRGKIGQQLLKKKKKPNPIAKNHGPFYAQTNEAYFQDCDIEPRILELFRLMINLDSTSLNPCQVVGQQLLHKCVPRDKIKHYAFSKVLGIGLNGFVFQCLYKNTEPRAVKMVIVSDMVQTDQLIRTSRVITSVTNTQLQREFKAHYDLQRMVTPSSGFKVLNIYGDLAVFKPPLYPHRIGVYIMQSLPSPTLLDEIMKYGLTTEIVRKIEQIPQVIAKLQKHGYAHSDLHIGNISFDPKDRDRPIVLDFGRTVHLTSTFSDQRDIATYCMFDYTMPLLSLSGEHNAAITSYNAFVGKMNVRETLKRVPSPQRGMFSRIFTPITRRSAQERKTMIAELLRQKLFHNRTSTFFDIAVPLN